MGWSRVFFLQCSVATVVALLAHACSSVQSRSIHFVGQPTFTPTDPATVAILHRPPMRPQEVLGQIVLEPEGDPSQEQLEDKLRAEMAQMGGSAAVIVYDGLERMGAVWTGGAWWSGGQIQRPTGRVVSAIVVRYTTDREP